MNQIAIQDQLSEAQAAIRMLQDELAETNRGLMALTMELEQRVDARTAELQAANQELEAFGYTVSHDLRAPLRAIDGYSRLIFEDFADKIGEDGRSMLETMRASVRDMGQLIDDLLAFSRLGRQELTRKPFDMRALALKVAQELQSAHPGRKIEFEIPESMPPAVGDQAMIREVLRNLLGNAVKFTAKREVAKIRLEWRAGEEEYAYSVSDNGVGFDMQFAEKIFWAFQRLHSTDEFEGTGIGLAIVQRIVHRHGGRVWAEGTVGSGATFHFTLPGAKGVT